MSQTLPHNADAEQYILGGIILDNELMLQTLDKISSEDFYISAHKPIYQAMEHLYDGGVEINHVTITDALRTLGLYSAGTTSEIAGLLMNLVKGVPASSNISYYVKILQERSRDRKKLRLSADLSSALYNGDSEAVDAIENQLNELSMERVHDGLKPLCESVGTSVLQKAHSMGVTGTKLIGLPTGIAKLDKLTAGLNKKEMMILAARPAMGKTALALNIAMYLANLGKVVAMFSMEMSREALYLRLIASEARVDLHRLKTGTLTGVEWARAIHAHDKVSKAPLLIDTNPMLSPRILETEIKKAKRRHGAVDMIIVDYLQLMDSNDRKESRQQEVTQISRQLREIAKREDASMLALSQLSRAPEGRASNGHRPQNSDLRESGAIEQDADIVAMLYREEVYNPDAVKGSAELIITKSRNSAIDNIDLFYVKTQTRFENVFIS
jgi:replicative DNA helicase